MFLKSCLYERQDGTKKAGVDDKTASSKETGFNILYIPFLFITNQFISKQSSHVKLLMLTQAHRNREVGEGEQN